MTVQTGDVAQWLVRREFKSEDPGSGMGIVRQSAYLRPTDVPNTPQPFCQYALV